MLLLILFAVIELRALQPLTPLRFLLYQNRAGGLARNNGYSEKIFKFLFADIPYATFASAQGNHLGCPALAYVGVM